MSPCRAPAIAATRGPKARPSAESSTNSWATASRSANCRRDGTVGDIQGAQRNRHETGKRHIEASAGAVLLGPCQEDRARHVVLAEAAGFAAGKNRGLGVEAGLFLVAGLGHRQTSQIGAGGIVVGVQGVQLMGKQRDGAVQKLRTVAFGEDAEIGPRGGERVHGEHRVGVVIAAARHETAEGMILVDVVDPDRIIRHGLQ